MSQTDGSALAAVDEHQPSFTRIERDLIRCRVGTLLRYHGGRDVVVVVLDDAFEVTSPDTGVQTWSWATAPEREHAATQAAQYVANRTQRSIG